MTFQWLHKQAVRSAEGFEVAFVGRDELEYREGDRRMHLEGGSMFADLEGREFGFSFDETWRTTPWMPPHQSNQISAADRARNRANIMNAFAFMNGKAKFL